MHNNTETVKEALCRIFESEDFSRTNITGNEDLRKDTAEIIELVEKEAFSESHTKARDLMYKILEMYVLPKMEKRERTDVFDVIKFLYEIKADEIAERVISINSNYHITLQSASEDDIPLDKEDTEYMLFDICSLYDIITDTFAEDEPK